MKFWKKLQNPFVLVGQGFLVGALMFWTMQPDSAAAPADSPDSTGSVLSTLQS